MHKTKFNEFLMLNLLGRWKNKNIKYENDAEN